MDRFVGKIFRHYKGSLYQVVTIARHTELTTAMNVTSEERGIADLVIYKQMADSSSHPAGYVWARPYNMFFDQVEIQGVPTNRFVLEP